MNTLIEWGNLAGVAWWLWTWRAAVQGAVLLGLVLLFLALWRPGTPLLRYGLLFLVLVKFVLPPVMSLSVGLFSWLPFFATAAPAVLGPAETGTVRLGAPASEAGLDAVDTMGPLAASSVAVPTTAAWALGLQCAGSVAFLLLVLAQTRRLRARLLSSQRLDQGPLHAHAKALAKRMGLRRVPTLYLSPEAASPQSGSFLRPFVVLPAWAQSLSAGEADILIAHELAHVRRRDGIANWLQVLAQALLWWNPAVWWLNARIRSERELCCDDAVLAHGIAEGHGYSRMLISAAERVSRQRPMLPAMGMADSFRSIDRRVRRALDPRPERRARMSVPTLLGLLAVAAWVLPGAPPAGADDVPEQSPADAAAQPDALDGPNLNRPGTFGRLVNVSAKTVNTDQVGRGTTTLSGEVHFLLQTNEGDHIEINAERVEIAPPEEKNKSGSLTMTGDVSARRDGTLISSDWAELSYEKRVIEFREATVTRLTDGHVAIAQRVKLNLVDGSIGPGDPSAEPLSFAKVHQVRVEALFVEVDPKADLILADGHTLAEILTSTKENRQPMVGLADDFEAARANIAELVARGMADIQSNPVLVAVENQESMISIGQEIPTKAPDENDVTHIFAGIELTVTARVQPTSKHPSSITLDTKAKVSKLKGHSSGIPIISKREMQGTMRLRSGQTMLILLSAQDEDRPLLLFLTADLFNP